MAYKGIIYLYKDKMKFDKHGNAIITLPPGTDRIQFQHEDKGGTVKDQQFEILVKEIREVKTEIKRVEVSLTEKIDAVDAKVDAVDVKVDAVDAKLDRHILEGH